MSDDLVRQVLQHFDYLPRSGMVIVKPGGYDVTMRRPRKRGRVDVLGKVCDSARVVWVLHHKAWPPAPLWRVNDDITDDRIENLKLHLPDGTVEGAGNRWIARPLGFMRRGDILGVFRTFEGALAASEAHKRGLDLV